MLSFIARPPYAQRLEGVNSSWRQGVTFFMSPDTVRCDLLNVPAPEECKAFSVSPEEW
jgi:hypothetical protein